MKNTKVTFWKSDFKEESIDWLMETLKAYAAKGIDDLGFGIQEAEGLGRSQVIADSDGLGQYLESYMNGIKEFHGNSKATDPKYANLRSQCYYKLAEMVNKRQIRIECTEEQKERIKDELGVIRALYLDDP